MAAHAIEVIRIGDHLLLPHKLKAAIPAISGNQLYNFCTVAYAKSTSDQWLIKPMRLIHPKSESLAARRFAQSALAMGEAPPL
jgi:hypothetical protein